MSLMDKTDKMRKRWNVVKQRKVQFPAKAIFCLLLPDDLIRIIVRLVREVRRVRKSRKNGDFELCLNCSSIIPLTGLR